MHGEASERAGAVQCSAAQTASSRYVVEGPESSGPEQRQAGAMRWRGGLSNGRRQTQNGQLLDVSGGEEAGAAERMEGAG